MSTLVVGLGNRDRGDDAVGLIVADALAGRDLPVTVVAWDGHPLDLIELWADHDHVVIVDACRTGRRSGTVTHVDGTSQRAVPHSTGGTHDFDLAAVIDLARRLQRLPPVLEVYGVEVDGLDHGADLSPEVLTAAQRVTKRLASQLAKEARHVPG